jgi:TonB family protein
MHSRSAVSLFLSLSVLFVPLCRAQQVSSPPPPAQPPAAAAPALSYRDTTGGLEHLGKDILDALKNGDAARAMALAQSMVLNDPAAWYHQTFGEYSGATEIANYVKQKPQLPLAILEFFKKGIQSGKTDVQIKRLDSGCDDNDGEDTFPTLDARENPTPLYDLRLFRGEKYMRLWPLSYVDGTFRFAAEPHPWEYFPPRPRAVAGPDGNSAPDAGETERTSRIRQGGNVAAAKLIKRVTPGYPDVARNEHLQGAVRLHAVIGKDGGIKQLRVEKGYCSLARASLAAVKDWRYTPTMLQGQPVEVDTTIDVIFQLNN